MQGNVMTS